MPEVATSTKGSPATSRRAVSTVPGKAPTHWIHLPVATYGMSLGPLVKASESSREVMLLQGTGAIYPVLIVLCKVHTKVNAMYWYARSVLSHKCVTTVKSYQCMTIHISTPALLISAAWPLKFLASSVSVSASSRLTVAFPALPNKHFHKSLWPTSSPPVLPVVSKF